MQPVVAGLTLLGAALYIVFAFVVQLLFLLLTPLLEFLLSLQGKPAGPQGPGGLRGLLQQLQQLQPVTVVNSDAGPLLPILGIGGVLLTLFLIWLFWEPRRRQRQQGHPEERESSLGLELPARRAGRSAPGACPRRPAARPLAALARDPRYRHTVQVRTIYRQLLDLGAARGVPRPAPQTADELLPALEQALPGDPAPLRTITAVYDQVRYRTDPATEAEAAAVTAAWQVVAARSG